MLLILSIEFKLFIKPLLIL